MTVMYLTVYVPKKQSHNMYCKHIMEICQEKISTQF